MLDKFFNTIERFNRDTPISYDFKQKMVEHFAYKWANDLNQFVEVDHERAIFEQLP